jgi:Tfp pilus assembly PilM family ATPase
VIFTKYDSLVTSERLALKNAGLEPTAEEVEENAKARFQRECISLFEERVGTQIPYVSVSSTSNIIICLTPLLYTQTSSTARSKYEITLNKLIGITYDNVESYIAEAAVVSGISQKLNASVKIRTSIE